MDYVVIIRGALGIGKSTIAQKLARRLYARYVSIDAALHKYGLDVVDSRKGCIPAGNFIKAQQKILVSLKKRNDARAILDGCFYHKPQIHHLRKAVSCPVFIFTLRAPVAVCIKRDFKRKKSYGTGAAVAVYKLVSRFTCGNVIHTNGKTASQTLKEILAIVEK